MIIINVQGEPKKIKHICYFARPSMEGADWIELWEMIEEYFDHPDSGGAALIQRYNTRWIRTERRVSVAGGAIVVLEAMENAVAEVERGKT